MIDRRLIACAGLAAMLLPLAGCKSPLERSLEEEMHEQLRLSQKQYRDAISAGQVYEMQPRSSPVEQYLDSPKVKMLQEADRLGGPDSYKGVPLELGRDLLNDTNVQMVAMSLRRAIELAVKNNLDVRIAALVPAVTDTQITQAEAVFDATLFANFTHNVLDTPQPSATQQVFGSVNQQNTGLETGIRKVLASGGQVSLSTEFNYNFRDPSFFTDQVGTSIFPNRNTTDANILLSVTQPLLRNFGTDVTQSQIMLSRSAREQAVQDLRAQMMAVVANTEQAYWQLVLARHRLLITTRLYNKLVELRKVIEKRIEVDATSDSLTDALSREELRRVDMIRARADVRQTSDALKQLIYSPQLPLSGETLIHPLDTPADLPSKFSLLDSVTTAIDNRPELRRSLLEIKDASIRQRVADNQRLPRLDASFGIRYNGVGNRNISEAYEDVFEGQFIDYLMGLQFEAPIGNRAAEAAYQQRIIERQASVINYRRVAQQVVRDVKDTMRALDTSYELIGAARSARRAAADRLRVLLADEKLDPQSVDLKLRAHETLAAAEIQEVQAIADYNVALARYYQAQGTLLEHNGIDFNPNAAVEQEE
jgi:outer membrane protein TolC